MNDVKKIEKDAATTAEEIAALEQEAAQATAAIKAGEAVSEDLIPRLRRRIEYLRIRLLGVDRRREVALTEQRLVDLHGLREEIEGALAGDGLAADVAEAGDRAYEALYEWFRAARVYNQRHSGWLTQLREHSVPGLGGAPTPGPEHAGLGLSADEIAIGPRRVGQVGVDMFAATCLAEAALTAAQTEQRPPAAEVPTLMSIKASFVREAPGIPEGTRFFRHATNDRVHAFSAAYIDRAPHVLAELEEISEEEFVDAQRGSARAS